MLNVKELQEGWTDTEHVIEWQTPDKSVACGSLEGRVKVALGEIEGEKVKIAVYVGITLHFQQDILRKGWVKGGF